MRGLTPFTMTLLPFSQAMSGGRDPATMQENVEVSPMATLTAFGVTDGIPKEANYMAVNIFLPASKCSSWQQQQKIDLCIEESLFRWVLPINQ